MFRFVFAILMVVGLVAPTVAAQRRVEATLLWGTHETQSPNPSHKILRESMASRLRKLPLTWTNYFEVTNAAATINDKDYTRVQLSDRSYIEIKERGSNVMTVKLWGRDKPTDKFTQYSRSDRCVPKGEILVIGGESKDKSAWLIVLTALENSPGFPPPAPGTAKPATTPPAASPAPPKTDKPAVAPPKK